MKLSHKNRSRHDHRVARRAELKKFKPLRDRAEKGWSEIVHLFGQEGTEVRISKKAEVGSRYQGTKAEVIRVVRPEGELAAARLFDLVVKVKAYRRKAPLLVRLHDLEYPQNGPVEDVAVSAEDALSIFELAS